MTLPRWLLPIAVNAVSKLVGVIVGALCKNVEDTPSKLDNKLISVVDKIISYKVLKSGTPVTDFKRKEIRKLLSCLKD
jgi:hypothetical protein